uniref:Riboflavin biosynthesis protein ribBA n=1 Tax=Lygus hesperus TaxID=30085 RepID=A0A0A9WRH0_LYGHE
MSIKPFIVLILVISVLQTAWSLSDYISDLMTVAGQSDLYLHKLKHAIRMEDFNKARRVYEKMIEINPRLQQLAFSRVPEQQRDYISQRLTSKLLIEAKTIAEKYGDIIGPDSDGKYQIGNWKETSKRIMDLYDEM